MRAFLLSGGAGTRLKEVLGSRLKPMAPVGGRPFLELLIDQLCRWDIRDITLCIGYGGEQIRAYFGDGGRWQVRISYSEEETPLGTGGALGKALRSCPDEHVLAMNGDSYFGIAFGRFMAFHFRKRAMASIALAKIDDPGRFGTVEIGRRAEVKGFKEKDADSSGPALINGGIYVLHRSVQDFIPEGTSSLERDVFPALIGKGLFAVRLEGFFIDIGIPEDYRRLVENPGRVAASAGPR
jgi:D-glycero-alpha-D-manno-heptose 1-phosphate guanylyltransferase